MIDLHNHVLFGADDGAQTIEESLALIRAAKAAGFSGAVLTPHFMLCRNFTKSATENQQAFAQLQARIAGLFPDFTLYLGSELYYDYRLVDLIGKGVFTTLGNTDYYLVETGRQGGTALGLQNFMLKLEQAGGKTILAHPERYDFVQDDPNVVMEFIQRGTLIQSNYLSLTGYYGKATTETMKILLENDMVQLMGSDAHDPEGYELFAEAKAAGEALIGAEKWHEITEINSHRLMNGETVPVKARAYKKVLSKAVIARYAL